MTTAISSRFYFALLVFCFVPVENVSAQESNSSITCGAYRTVHSSVLGEDRTVLVHLPDDYGTTDKKYPVIYKLDGNKGNFLQACSAAYYLFDMTDSAPDPLIVGIENTDRNRDMMPGQGAENFIRWIKTELIPFIDANYRTDGFRIVCGQSLSSVFALYSFLIEPSLFDAYILSSFGLFNEEVVSRFEEGVKKNSGLTTFGKKYIFVAQGRRDLYDPDGSKTKRGMQFLDTLAKTVPVSVAMKSRYYDDEGHVPFPSIHDGLVWIYACEKTRTK